MAFKHFRLQIALRVLLLLASLMVIAFVWNRNGFVITTIVLCLFAALQTVSLILYVEKTNRHLARFLSSIRHSDFSVSFTDEGLGESFAELHHEFNQLIEAFRINRAEKEEHFNYLLTVVQHVSIGIIVFKRDGKVDVFNNAVKKMLRLSHLRHINELTAVKDDLPAQLLQMQAGDKSLIKVFLEDELIQLSINATEFRMQGETYVLVSLQNIHPELEDKEIESWQRLIRVLTHEIMNSITPISSLTATLQDMLIDPQTGQNRLHQLDNEDLENITTAINTIGARSRGLLNFVEVYRSLTRIPKPNFRYFPVKTLFARVSELLKPKLDSLDICCRWEVFPDDLMLLADPDLVDQVIINLILNAMDAVKQQPHPRISIIASQNVNNRITIDVADNGHGIKPDLMDKIFMPFFTSKKEGSGIGLSLSRQIMQMHKGAISVKSKPEEGTVVTLMF